MNHRIKRQQFAKQLRDQHRKKIINKNRSKPKQSQIHEIFSYLYLQQILAYKQSPQPYSQFQNLPHLSGRQQSLLSRKNDIGASEQINQFYMRVLKPLPPYISNLINKQNKDIQRIGGKIMQICYDALVRSMCLKQATQCLIQLTNLESVASLLHHITMMELVSAIGQTTQNSYDNAQITLNCCYIIGNLYQDILKIREQCEINNQQNNYKHFGYIQYTILDSLNKICASFPYYHDCLLLMIWFLRNCLLVSINIDKQRINCENSMQTENSKKQNTGKLYSTTVVLIKSVVNISCINIIHEKYQFSVKQQYLLTALCQSLQLLSLIIVYSSLWCNQQVSKHLTQNNSESLSLNTLIQEINETLSIVINNNRIMSSSIVNNTMSELCSNLSSQVFCFNKNSLTNISNIPAKIKSIYILQNFCMLATSGLISGSMCFKVCSQILQSVHIKPKLKIQLLQNIVSNFEELFKLNKQIVYNRDRRINLMSLINTLLDVIPVNEVKCVVSETILKLCYSSIEPLSTRIHVENQLEVYFNQVFVPILLNISELLLIDKDSENVQLALKIIWKLIQNWEINKQVLSSTVQQMGIHLHILNILQDNCSQSLYEVAASTLDILQIS